MKSSFNIAYIHFAVLLVCLQSAYGQHYQFSQFYAAPTYLNPAFTGADVCSRVSLNYRNQWSGIPGGFTTYQASVDHALSRYKGGIGLQFFNDKTGLGGLSTTQMSLLYAYETRINKKLMGRAGISAGGVQRRVNMGSFTFGDQISRRDASSSVEGADAASIKYFALNVGVVVFSRTAWGGVAASNINEPNQSLTGGSSALPAEFKVHGGYKYTFNERVIGNSHERQTLTLAFNYKKQAKYNQIDLGVYFTKDMLVIGCWYRGIPIFKPVREYINNDALVFLFGISVGKYNIGYSYDLTLSKLTNANTKGTHELSMSYQFCKLKKSQKRRLVVVSCPKF